MNDSAHGAEGYHRRKLFWIGVIALFTVAFTVSLRAAVYDRAKLEAAGGEAAFAALAEGTPEMTEVLAHAAEQSFQAIALFPVLLDETDSALVEFELDLYWIRAGGRSELEYFERYPGRFTLWHVKDMDTQGEMIDVGDGVIDFAALFDRDGTGVRYAFVEHDNPSDPESTIRRSHAALAQMLKR